GGLLAVGGLDKMLFDATAILPPSSWWGTLVKGLFSVSATPTRLEIAVWFAYLVPTMVLFLRPPAARQSAGAPSAPASPESQTTVGAR
ncbi:MAG: iron transporter, partial [Actinomycetota bacterium]|nr:iron transporter [Actinomycetota bacterium]